MNENDDVEPAAVDDIAAADGVPVNQLAPLDPIGPPAPNPATPNPWIYFTFERLRRFCTENGITNPAGNRKEHLIAALMGAGVSSSSMFKSATASNTTARCAKLTLKGQGTEEDVETFIQRADIFFKTTKVPDEDQIVHLMNTGKQNVLDRINDLLASGISDPKQIKEALCTEFSISRFERMERFRQQRPRPTETFHQFGARIRHELLKYLLMSEADVLGNISTNSVVTAMLIDQLVKIIEPAAAAYVKMACCANPQMTWTNVLQLAEDFHRNNSSGSVGGRRHCSNHGWGTHSTKYCKPTTTSSTSHGGRKGMPENEKPGSY